MMKRYMTPKNIVYFICMSFLLNSYMVVKAYPLALTVIIPLFLLLNIFPGFQLKGIKSRRLRTCNHGVLMLTIFVASLIPSILWHITLAFLTIPHAYMDLIWSMVYCIVASALLFWNGILCVYTTSTQMGIKWRAIGILCGMIPILNLVVLTKIIKVTADEVEYEIEREIIAHDPALSELCKTKYPIILIHGVFFRDNKLFNYWGRIPRTLKLHGATIYYGEHQSALPVKESARELAARIKLIVERSGCEKVNLIAHSKGGLDCRYAISEFGIGDYVASLTTVNTPHRGCLFAEQLLNTIPQKIQDKIARAYNVTLTALGDETPDFMAAVTDLTAEACIERNKLLTFPEGIFAQSIGSVMGHPRKGQFPLNLCYPYVKQYDGDNDGLVGENSFEWGEKYTLLRCKGKRGISHCDIIDLGQENLPDFDVRAFYTDLVSDLRNRGF